MSFLAPEALIGMPRGNALFGCFW